MKLRNKKTGEVVVEINKIGLVWNKYGMPAEIGQYDSIAELCEEWEDYKPKEPLIKDEKVRNVIRSWAEANDMDVSLSVFYREDRCTLSALHAMKIEFSKLVFADLEKNRSYTITELCGEEEE